jgi:hypothetical protein
MKKSISIAILGILAISFVVWLTGCASTGGLNTATASTVAKIASKDATYFALKQNPQWRPAFEQAFSEVSVLAAQDKIDVAALAAIVARLPVKELKGTTAQIIISDVEIVVEQIVPNSGEIVSADKFTDPKIIIAAIRDGMRLGLDMP